MATNKLPCSRHPSRLLRAHGMTREPPLQILGECLGAGIAVARFLLQAPEANQFQSPWNLGPESHRCYRCLADGLQYRLQCRRTPERRPAGEEFVEYGTERINVGRRPNVAPATVGLLGCEIARRPENSPGWRPDGK